MIHGQLNVKNNSLLQVSYVQGKTVKTTEVTNIFAALFESRI